MSANTKESWECSFCKNMVNEAGKIVSGPDGLHICEECVCRCQRFIKAIRAKEKTKPTG